MKFKRTFGQPVLPPKGHHKSRRNHPCKANSHISREALLRCLQTRSGRLTTRYKPITLLLGRAIRFSFGIYQRILRGVVEV